MAENEKRINRDRRIENRRQEKRRENTHGIQDRRGEMERRKYSRRMEDKEEQIQQDFKKIFDDQIEGRNAVLELLESNKDINKIYITKGEKKGSINKIIAMANEKKIIVVEKEKKQMDFLAGSENYQGVIAIVPPYKYCDVKDILEVAKERKEKPFIIVLDGIEDTHNLGAIIRTAEAAGVHGIIIPKRRAASVNSTVSKVACGALEYMKIARVNNITETIKELKESGIWIIGTDLEAAEDFYKQDFDESIAIVIGNEQKGISENVKKNCDFLTKIPMIGKVQSLNASVCAGIIIYEVVKQRKI